MKTKIVATIGPATSDYKVLKELIQEGANVCRLNFSHDTHENKRQAIDRIRQVNKELGKHTAILADLQGPKIRTGMIKDNLAILEEGAELIFTTEVCEGDKDRVFVSYKDFAKDVSPGEQILLDDGKLQVEVVKRVNETDVLVRVIGGGPLSSRKGVNMPDTSISIPSITEKDKEDLIFALQQDVNWVALSFVRSARDIRELRAYIKEHAPHHLPGIIAKIEKPEAVENIDEIIDAADAIMIARGDLGVEIPLERVPLIQKSIITKCQKKSCPVIVATQMMEGMIDSMRPTRAEVSDVAYSVMQGADAVMTSGETSTGKYPIKTIQTMRNIIREVEAYETIYYKHFLPEQDGQNKRFINDSILYSACNLAQHTSAQAIMGNTHSGYSAFRIAAQRPKAGIYIFAKDPHLAQMMSLVWGVEPFYIEKFEDTDIMILRLEGIMKEKGLLRKGDAFVMFGSALPDTVGKTNMLFLNYVD